MSNFSAKSRQISYRMAACVGEIQRAALEFIYPPACLLCHAEADRPANGSVQLCGECLKKLAPPAGNACRRCGAPVGPYTRAEDSCLVCKRENYAFDEVIRLGLYRDELRIACLKAKNPAGAPLGQTLADILVDSRQTSLAAQRFDAVIPVPEHWLRRLFRTHYAAETIARQISLRLKTPLSAGILAKSRWTPKQAKSPPVQRRQQQQNAFRAAEVGLQAKTVLLVDDILTTGATADAAARALKRAGASRVVVAVVAVSPPRA